MAINIEGLQAFIKHIPGFCLVKNHKGGFYGISHYGRQFTGLKDTIDITQYTDYDMPWAQYADLYHESDKKTFADGAWIGIETICGKSPNDVHTYLVSKIKVALADNNHPGIFAQFSPINDANIVSLCHTQNKLISAYGENAISKIIDVNRCEVQLSRRQQEILFFQIRGKSARQIGEILNLSQRTVESHTENLKLKFNVDTKSQLLEKAIQQGYANKIP